MIEDRPGFFWCDQCGEYIANQFTDHEAQHAATTSISWVGRLEFWGFSVAAGLLGGVVVLALT